MIFQRLVTILEVVVELRLVFRFLPQRPHIDIPKREAHELLNAWRVAQ